MSPHSRWNSTSEFTTNGSYNVFLRNSSIGTFSYVEFSILTVLTPCVLVGNISVLACLIKFPRLRTSMNLLIANLAIGDVLIGLLTAPLYALMYISEELSMNKWLCLIKFSAVIGSFSCTLITLALLSVERYLAVFHPLHYNAWITKQRMKIAIAIVWMYILPISGMAIILGLNKWDEKPNCEYFDLLPEAFTITSFVVTTGISFPVAVICFSIITYKIRKVQKRVRTMKHLQQRGAESRADREKRAGMMMAFIFLLFIIFWLPFAMIIPFRYVLADIRVIGNLKNLAVVIAMGNSVVNPIVYCWCKPELRMAICSVLQCKSVRNRAQTLTHRNTAYRHNNMEVFHVL